MGVGGGGGGVAPLPPLPPPPHAEANVKKRSAQSVRADHGMLRDIVFALDARG
jgi:hypothetical protein